MNVRRYSVWSLDGRAVCAVLACLCIEASARAEDVEELHGQPTVEDASEALYEREIDAALNEYDLRNLQESREHFRRAHALRPSARTLRGLGKVEFELRNYVEALTLLRGALASREHALDQLLRDEVDVLITRALGYVGTLRVELSPATGVLSVDGEKAGDGPLVELPLMVGDHVLDFRASGYVSERRSLRIHGGDDARLKVTLEPVARAAPDAPPPTSPERHSSRAKWWGVSIAAGVLVAGAIALGVGLAARNDGEGRLSGGSTGLVLDAR